MKTIWKGIYLGNSIEVHNTWFRGEKLFINETLQDISYGWFGQSKLECELPNRSSKTNLRVKLISGFWKIKCYVFADGREIKMNEIK
ncbi:MAG: hypothetical protein ACPGVD_00125 [Flavobacteriales bacterium]